MDASPTDHETMLTAAEHALMGNQQGTALQLVIDVLKDLVKPAPPRERESIAAIKARLIAAGWTE